MPTLTESNYVGDVVAFEEDEHYSRETVTIKTGNGVLALGTVLGQLTADSKYVPAVAAAADGSETAIAVLLQEADSSAADVTNVVVLRRHASAKRAGLVLDASINDGTKKAAMEAQLLAVGILVRDSA